MENSFFHERAGGLVLAALPPGVHVTSRKSEISALCRDVSAASGEEGKVLPLFILQSLSSCLWRSCPFQFFVRRPLFFQREKGVFTVAVFLQFSRDFTVRPLPFVLMSWALGGNSAGRTSLPPPGEAYCCREMAKVLQISATGRSAEPTGHRRMGPLQRIRRRDTNIFSGGEKGSFTSQTYGFFIFPCPARLVMVPSDFGAIFWAKKCLKPQFHIGNFKIRIGSVRFSGRSSQ